MALGLAALVYFAFRWLIPRRKLLGEVMPGDQVSAADIARATDALTNAALRMNEAAKLAPPADRDGLVDMSRHLTSIRELIRVDPKDHRKTRQFIGDFLPQIVTTVESYVSLAKLANGDNAVRLAELGGMIKSFARIIGELFGNLFDDIDISAFTGQFTHHTCQICCEYFLRFLGCMSRSCHIGK